MPAWLGSPTASLRPEVVPIRRRPSVAEVEQRASALMAHLDDPKVQLSELERARLAAALAAYEFVLGYREGDLR